MKEDKQFCEQSSLPRVINKRSGLTNFNRTTVEIINTFLTCISSPVCLVAHNRNAYDFPLLKAELEKIGMQLNPGILCADSLPGIKEAFQKMTDSYSTKLGKLKKNQLLRKKLRLQVN